MRRSQRRTRAASNTPDLGFVALYDTHVETVYRYIHRRCRDHPLAEDVTQETFLTAVRTVHDPSSVTIGWLLTVARNQLFDVLRRRTRYDDKLRLVANAGRSVSDVDIAERLRVEAALAELPVHYRLVLTLHYVNGLPVAEIADELDRSLKSVEGLITRARRSLAALLAETPASPRQGGQS